MKKNKKGAIAATMTWVIATIIILIVIIFFIYASFLIAKKKDLLNLEILKKEDSNIEAEQSLLAILKTKINSKTVEDYILEENYNEVKEDVEEILDMLDIKGEAEVYIKDTLVKSDGDDLDIG